MDNGPRPNPEELLLHTEWMLAMAVSLVGDRSRADDIVQGAWTAAVESPPRSRVALGAWLHGVVRNLSRQSHRQESRRRRREAIVAKSELQFDSAEELVARAELQRVIIDSVLSLDEPYRTTVILRFFEDRTPHEIANRDAVPVKTVWTRLSRALQQLRSRLNREYGDQDQWRSILIPFIGAPAATTAGLTTSASASASVSTAPTTTAATSTLLTTTLGSAFVMSKLTLGISCVALVAVGLAIGHFTSPRPAAVPGHMIAVDKEAYSDLQSERQRLEAELIAARSKHEEQRTAAAQLAADGETLQAELDAANAANAALVANARPETTETPSPLPVAFGKYADLDGVKNANWEELASAVANMTAILFEVTKLENSGQDLPAGYQQEIIKENQKLLTYLAGVATHIDSHALHNGEYTHPVTLTNILGAMLDQRELPLDDQQRRRIVEHGESFETEYDRLQTTYDGDTPHQRKILDELTLKRSTMRSIEDELSSEQRSVVVKPWLHDRIEVDPRSPVQMLAMTVRSFAHNSPAELRAALPTVISKLYQIPPEKLVGLDAAYDRYMVAVESLLDPIPATEMVKFFPIDAAIVAGEAFSDLVGDVWALPSVDDEARQRILHTPRWFVPRIRE